MYDETNNSCKNHGGILTEAGIVLETGETICV